MSEKTIGDAEFARPEILDPDESEPVELEEVDNPNFTVAQEELEHLEQPLAPEDLEGVEVTFD